MFYVFDFDGTLADSKQIWIDSIYDILKKHKYNLSRKQIESKMGSRLREILKECQESPVTDWWHEQAVQHL